MSLWNPLAWIIPVFGIVVAAFSSICRYILEIPKMIGAKTTIKAFRRPEMMATGFWHDICSMFFSKHK